MSDLDKFQQAMLQKNFQRAEFIAKEISLKAPKIAEVLIAAVSFERDGIFEYNSDPTNIRNREFRNIALLLKAEINRKTEETLFVMNTTTGEEISVTPHEWVQSKNIFLRLLGACHQLGLTSLIEQVVVRWKKNKHDTTTALSAVFLTDLCVTLIEYEFYDNASDLFVLLNSDLMANIAKKMSQKIHRGRNNSRLVESKILYFLQSLLINKSFTHDICTSFLWSFTRAGNMRFFISKYAHYILEKFPDSVDIYSIVFRSDVHITFDKKSIDIEKIWNAVLVNADFNLAAKIGYHLPFISPSISKEIQWSNDLRGMWEEKFSVFSRAIPAQPKAPEQYRITFCSYFLGNHGIGHALYGIVDKLKAHGFSFDALNLGSERSDDVFQGHIKDHAEEWYHAATNDTTAMREAREWLKSRNSDAVINLDGFMDPDGLNLLHYNGSPLTMYWIGHGGKLNLPFIDYVITDSFVNKMYPEDFGEKEIVLENSFVSFGPIEYDTALQKKDFNLPEDKVVFSCFNNPVKVTQEYLECLARVAIETKFDVVFWFNFADRAEYVHLIVEKLTSLGVPKSCIRFGGRLEPKSKHFARLAVSDAALDTFHVNMASGALDCMWVGTPVVTLVGKNFTSRICGSFNKTIGLENFNVETQDEYVAKAIQLVREPSLLSQARQHLLARKAESPLFNGAAFAADLCAGLKLAIERARRGEAPTHLDVSAHRH